MPCGSGTKRFVPWWTKALEPPHVGLTVGSATVGVRQGCKAELIATWSSVGSLGSLLEQVLVVKDIKCG